MPGAPAHPMPHPASLIPLKRRLSDDAPSAVTTQSTTSSARDRGRVTCEACGQTISFTDATTGTFTLEHWDAHRLACGSPADPAQQAQTQPPPALSPPPPPLARKELPSAQPTSDGPPPPKRRRAKRTEEERIHYLRSDPFVAQFEAYRVLCGSCNKWIRLRPNSTYCSIPWDSHRKSCLAKNGKINKIDGDSLVKAHAATSSNGSRAPPHPQSAQTAGTSSNKMQVSTQSDKDDGLHDVDADADADAEYDEDLDQGDVAASASVSTFRPAATNHDMSIVSSVSAAMPPPAAPAAASQSPRPSPYTGASPAAGSQRSQSPSVTSTPLPASRAPSFPPQAFLLPAALASPSALTSPRGQPGSDAGVENLSAVSPDERPSEVHDVREPRRRNADQRAAALRSDPLLAEVEPNRVFCSLCQKWVQLRQDSTYCAYPWVQHRTKCVKRHQRRTEKAAEFADARQRREDEKQLRYEQRTRERALARRGSIASGRALSEVESEEGITAEEARRVAEATGWTVHHGEAPRTDKVAHFGVEVDELMDDAPGAGGPRAATRTGSRRPSISTAPRLADLDSPTGRLTFIAHSIEYLFTMTYERTDELTADALSHYLNAAMPPEKHEEFDAVEVQQALPDLPGPFAPRLSVVTGDNGIARIMLAS